MKKSVGRLLGVAGALAMAGNLAWADGVGSGSGGSSASVGGPVQAILNLSNLNYTLTDLDAADGVTPSLTSSPSSVFSVYARAGDFSNSVSSGMLPGDHLDGSSSNVALPNGQGSASKLGNNQLTDASLTSTTLQAAAPIEIYTQVKTYATFTLSAHSSLVISGDLMSRTYIDAAAVSALAANSDGTLAVTSEASFSPYIDAGSGVELKTNATSASNGPFGGNMLYMNWKAAAAQSFSALGAGVFSSSSDMPGGQIQMQITNNNDVDTVFNLNSIAYTRVSITTTVPEPASWALTGLGLLGVAAVARRQRRA